MLNLLTNWRMMLWVGFHIVLIVGSFLPQTGELLAGWWNEQQNAGHVRWRVTRQITSRLGWWSRVRQVCRWGRALMLLSLSMCSNSRFVAAISKSRVSSRVKRPARLRNRGYDLTFHP